MNQSNGCDEIAREPERETDGRRSLDEVGEWTKAFLERHNIERGQYVSNEQRLQYLSEFLKAGFPLKLEFIRTPNRDDFGYVEHRSFQVVSCQPKGWPGLGFDLGASVDEALGLLRMIMSGEVPRVVEVARCRTALVVEARKALKVEVRRSGDAEMSLPEEF